VPFNSILSSFSLCLVLFSDTQHIMHLPHLVLCSGGLSSRKQAVLLPFKMKYWSRKNHSQPLKGTSLFRYLFCLWGFRFFVWLSWFQRKKKAKHGDSFHTNITICSSIRFDSPVTYQTPCAQFHDNVLVYNVGMD